MTLKRKPRAYDKERKAAIDQKLRDGLKALRRTKVYRDGKPITAYALAKYTGISIRTVKRRQEILDLLDETVSPAIGLKTAVVDTGKIRTLEQAIGIVEELTKLYNETKDKYNKAAKTNSALNLEVVKLKDENDELRRALRRQSE